MKLALIGCLSAAVSVMPAAAQSKINLDEMHRCEGLWAINKQHRLISTRGPHSIAVNYLTALRRRGRKSRQKWPAKSARTANLKIPARYLSARRRIRR